MHPLVAVSSSLNVEIGTHATTNHSTAKKKLGALGELRSVRFCVSTGARAEWNTSSGLALLF